MVGSVTGHEVHTAGSAVAGPTVTNSATPAAAAAARRRVPAPIRRLASRNRVLTRDLKTRRRWGRTAPKFAEQVWIDPAACTSYIYGIPRSASGQVRDGAWDLEPIELTNSPNIKASRQHWIDGVAWDQTALFEYFDEIIARKGAADGFTCREQLDERYATLDTIFEQVKADGRLKTRSELAPGTFRESRRDLHALHPDRYPGVRWRWAPSAGHRPGPRPATDPRTGRTGARRGHPHLARRPAPPRRPLS